MWFWGCLGDALFITGIVTGAMKVTIAGFSPVSWFLMAIACYLGMIWSITLRIVTRMEAKAEG